MPSFDLLEKDIELAVLYLLSCTSVISDQRYSELSIKRTECNKRTGGKILSSS